MHNLTLTWNGKKWETSGLPTNRMIAKGQVLQIVLPEHALVESDQSAAPKLLFPKGSILYLPIMPVRDETELHGRCMRENPKITNRPKNKELLPIVLQSDLYIDPINEQLHSCVCQFAGDDSQTFKSVNDAAKSALKTWTNRETAAVGVFMEVRFVHDAQLLQIDMKRDEVLHEQPLPDNPDRDDTGDLFANLTP